MEILAERGYSFTTTTACEIVRGVKDQRCGLCYNVQCATRSFQIPICMCMLFQLPRTACLKEIAAFDHEEPIELGSSPNLRNDSGFVA